MKEKLTKESVGFTQIKNEVLQDKMLSLKAKGLFAYIYSKPDDWDFSGDRMANENSDGRKSIYAALKELESRDYLERIKRPDGKSDYYIHYSKKPNVQKGQEAEEPNDQKGKEPKRQRAKKVSISNKELITNIDSITNIEEKLTQKTQKFIEELKETMKGVTIKKEQIEEIKKFISYWTEPDKNWKTQKDPKIRYDHQKTWDTKRRLATWMKNQITFAGGKTQNNNKYQITEE